VYYSTLFMTKSSSAFSCLPDWLPNRDTIAKLILVLAPCVSAPSFSGLDFFDPAVVACILCVVGPLSLWAWHHYGPNCKYVFAAVVGLVCSGFINYCVPTEVPVFRKDEELVTKMLKILRSCDEFRARCHRDGSAHREHEMQRIEDALRAFGTTVPPEPMNCVRWHFCYEDMKTVQAQLSNSSIGGIRPILNVLLGVVVVAWCWRASLVPCLDNTPDTTEEKTGPRKRSKDGKNAEASDPALQCKPTRTWRPNDGNNNSDRPDSSAMALPQSGGTSLNFYMGHPHGNDTPPFTANSHTRTQNRSDLEIPGHTGQHPGEAQQLGQATECLFRAVQRYKSTKNFLDGVLECQYDGADFKQLCPWEQGKVIQSVVQQKATAQQAKEIVSLALGASCSSKSHAITVISTALGVEGVLKRHLPLSGEEHKKVGSAPKRHCRPESRRQPKRSRCCH